MGTLVLLVDRDGSSEPVELSTADSTATGTSTATNADVGIGLAAAGEGAASEEDFPVAILVVVAVLIVAAVAAFLIGFRSTRRKAETLEHEDGRGRPDGPSTGAV